MALRRLGAAKAAVALLAVFALLLPPAPASAASAPAQDITKRCGFRPSSNASAFRNAYDGSYRTVWTSSASGAQYVDIAIPMRSQAGGLYFRWGGDAPPAWRLYAYDQYGKPVQALSGGGNGYLTDYEYIPSAYADCKKFRLQAAKSGVTLSIAELSVYTPGSAPYYAPHWQPFSGRADILLIATHPDDEQLYLGPVAPTYIEQGKKVVTAFMTYCGSTRRLEAQESVWSSGETCYPAMRYAKDVQTSTLVKAEKYWPLDQTVGYIVEQIRRFKPSVVVTQDINGEYGHGAHKLTSYATQIAFNEAGDPRYYPDSAKKYGVWNAGKLYIHLYKQQQIVLDIKARLSAYGGQTVLDVVKAAYNRHRSQLPGRVLPVSGKYDFRIFGLFASRVGPDRSHASMLENITGDAMLALNPSPVVAVDRTALSSALADAKSRMEADYTAASWLASGLPDAIGAAQAVYDDPDARQVQVDARTGALNSALGLLVRRALAGIEVARLPLKLVYAVGEPLDIAGLSVTGRYNDGGAVPLRVTAADISGFDSSAPAKGQALTVTIQGKTCAFAVDILEPLASNSTPPVEA